MHACLDVYEYNWAFLSVGNWNIKKQTNNTNNKT